MLSAGPLTSRAVQSPSISLDMVTSGNSYDGATNSMSAGNIDNCLVTSPPGNNAQHNHLAQLTIQSVEDLIGWQARLNYNGGQMRPSTVNFTPFTDDTTAQNVSFLNLPLEGGVHRDLVTASSIPPQAPEPQTALIGAAYIGAQNFAVSPDTPAKTTPDDTSYSAPSGGVLAAVSLQVPAGQAAQASLYIDLDDANPEAPGSGVSVFTGSGSSTIDLAQSDLGDGFHAEGAAACLVPSATPTETPTPSVTPIPTPTATVAPTPSATPTPPPTPGAGGSFNPSSTLTFADTAPGANSDITLTFNLEAPDLNFADVVSFSPPQLLIPADAEIPDGATVGTLNSQATLGLLNNPCIANKAVNFTFYDATTNINNPIYASFNYLAGDTNGDGIQDIKPAPVVTQYPAFLNTLYGGAQPRARYAAATFIPSD